MIIRLAALGAFGYVGYKLLARSRTAQLKTARFRPRVPAPDEPRLQSIPMAEPADYLAAPSASPGVPSASPEESGNVLPKRPDVGTGGGPQS